MRLLNFKKTKIAEEKQVKGQEIQGTTARRSLGNTVHQRELAQTLKTQEALKSSQGNKVIKSEQVTGERKELSAYSSSVKTPSRLPVREGKELVVNDAGRLMIKGQYQKSPQPKSEVAALKQEGGVQPLNNPRTTDETVIPNTNSLVKAEPTEEVANMKKLKFEVISPEIMVGTNISKVEQRVSIKKIEQSSIMERKIPVVPRAVEFKKTGFKRARSQ